MSQIAIINSSTVVPDSAGQKIVNALNVILPQFCNDWLLPKFTAVYIAKGKTTTIKYKLFLLDSADVEDAFGYHSLSNGIPYGKAFASTVLQYGGALLYSPNPATPTFAQTVCHEVFELLIDPNVNTWWDNGDGQTLYAAEVSDPVQGNTLTVNITTNGFNSLTGKAGLLTTKVGLSDWILPSWSNPQNTKRPFNHNNTLTAPFTLDNGGYAVRMIGGNYEYVFGSKVSPAKKAELLSKKISR